MNGYGQELLKREDGREGCLDKVAEGLKALNKYGSSLFYVGKLN